MPESVNRLMTWLTASSVPSLLSCALMKAVNFLRLAGLESFRLRWPSTTFCIRSGGTGRVGAEEARGVEGFGLRAMGPKGPKRRTADCRSPIGNWGGEVETSNIER